MIDLSQYTPQQRREMLALYEERDRRAARNKLATYYPDEGPLRRELYPKHLEFFAHGKEHAERAFVAGNRVGKTTCAAYEITCHLTGRYADWWPGYRFDRPIDTWACGIDAKQVRDTIQQKLLGPFGYWGTGLIPGDDVEGKPTSGGVPESVDTLRVKSQFGGVSILTFKNYEQDRVSYQGTEKDVVWYDEEPPMSLYTEGLTRTMSTRPGQRNGLVMCTFTPLLGISDVVRAFLPEYKPT